MRRISLLAASATALAAGALLGAGTVAGLAADRPLVIGLMAGSTVAVLFGLGAGWRPALALSTVLAVLAGLPLAGPPARWGALVLVATAAAVSHEAARVSIDLRRPARLGPGVLAGLAGRSALLVAAGGGTALAAAQLQGHRVAPGLVPVALVVVAAPLALPRLTAVDGAFLGPGPGDGRSGPGGHLGPGLGRFLDGPRWGSRAVMAGALSLAVLGAALLGATARQDIETTTVSEGPASRASGDDAELPTEPVATVPAGPRPTPGGGSRHLLDVLLLVLASAVVVLLVAGLRRNQIPLETEPVDLGPDDPGLDIVAPTGAQLDDEVVRLADEAAAAILTEITVDLRSEPDPGRAVRYAYARVEHRLAQEGIERRAAESEPEYMGRILATLGDDGSALAHLTELFERARFSRAPVPEAMRGAALAALDRLRSRWEVSP